MRPDNIGVPPGDTVRVALESNPSTGYTWEVTSNDPSKLKQVGESEFKADRNLPGAGGRQTLTFQAGVVGRTVLNLEYQRPWQRTTPPEKAFEVTVVVK